MRNKHLVALLLLATPFLLQAQPDTDSIAVLDKDTVQWRIDSLEKALHYQTGNIILAAGNAEIKVPAGFRFLNPEQAQYVLSDLWGNPPDSSIIGLLVPTDRGVLSPDSWAFTISYDEMGYVKDDDAADINYDQLLKDQQKEVREANADRVANGFESVDFINWASAPYYDKERKTLHWAKELKFGDDSVHTLNYNIRVLGRRGIYLLNAIAGMKEMPVVKKEINKVVNSIEFQNGSRYADYESGSDNVAAWTVGGLVAGKILAKTGFFVLLLKFWKLIALAVVGAGSGMWNWLRGKKKKSNAPAEDFSAAGDPSSV
ncbi:MAG TPA: DUF2167 domain-containing protein [Flavihumibacter sp.]|nr:DUF2167 domain-containing protein [Bacteroidota bacterium]HPZ87287.1 DUF2167 domain-containing protein [Flavihumibacter sp.]HQD10068.1 DUF2167 domain-containing protein [Flavihumibacter sp.]